MNPLSILATFVARFRYGKQLDPARDWIALLTLAALLFAAILVWNAWAFDTVVNGGIIGSAPAKVAPVFNSDSLAAIRALFDRRAEEESKYVAGGYQFADPSQ